MLSLILMLGLLKLLSTWCYNESINQNKPRETDRSGFSLGVRAQVILLSLKGWQQNLIWVPEYIETGDIIMLRSLGGIKVDNLLE